MPTYEFRCPNGHEFEKFYRTISGAESAAQCPQCALLAERMMSAAGFAFKGSGFYLTDYGKNAHRDKGVPDGKPSPSASGEGSSESSKSDGASSESKAEPKGESAKGGDSAAAPAGEAKKAEPKAAAEAKPTAAPPKPSASE